MCMGNSHLFTGHKAYLASDEVIIGDKMGMTSIYFVGKAHAGNVYVMKKNVYL